jgi:hypothetical protein
LAPCAVVGCDRVGSEIALTADAVLGDDTADNIHPGMPEQHYARVGPYMVLRPRVSRHCVE